MYSSEITGSARTSPAANHYKTDGYIAQLTRYCFAFSLRRPIHHCSTICRRLSFFLLLGYTTNYRGIAHDSTIPHWGLLCPRVPDELLFPDPPAAPVMLRIYCVFVLKSFPCVIGAAEIQTSRPRSRYRTPATTQTP